jgi:hypothetical protein
VTTYRNLLADRPTRRLLTGLGVSSLGDGISTVTIAWLAVVCDLWRCGIRAVPQHGPRPRTGRLQLPQRIELKRTAVSQTDGVTHLEYRVLR